MENKELAIVTYIKKYGLDDAVSTFKLKLRDYGHKILLKYSQIDSDKSLKEVQECRGLILEKDTWKVMSLAFTRFFNSGETQAAKIDWESAYNFEKLDGSLIQVYFDWVIGKWCAGTSGMAEGEGEVNDKPNTSFAELFWETVNSYEYFHIDNLTKGKTYSFELMTPYNVVVKPHPFSHLALLAIRDLETLQEEFYPSFKEYVESEICLPVVKAFNINAANAGHLISTLEDLPAFDEGYVVCDKNFNRIKIKNPKYVALHHLKGKMNKHHILTLVKSNEVDEFIASFPERREEILTLQKGYKILVKTLNNMWDTLENYKPKNITKQEQKKFAMKVFEVINNGDKTLKGFSGLFFSLKDHKVKSVEDFMNNFDNKKLFEILSK